MSKLLINLFMLKTRLIVNTYTITTLPFYYIIQKPWKTTDLAKRLRTKKFTINGEFVWKRDDQRVSHPILQYKSYAEVLQNLKNIYDPNRHVVGHRDVIGETVVYDKMGNKVTVNGRVLRNYVWSVRYKWLSLNDVLQRVDNIAKGLIGNDVKKGDKVIIWAETRLEWLLCSLALIKVNATIVTLFSNLGTSGLIYAINQTEAKTIITTFDLLPKLSSLLKQVPNIESIVYIKNINDLLSDSFPKNISIKSLDELESLGSEHKNDIIFGLPSNTEETAVIMYTSGTTGNPKAVCISHKQLMATIRVLSCNSYDILKESDRHLHMTFLPLAHILGFTIEMFLFFSGVRIGYSKGQKSDAKLLEPTFMTTVPLVLDRIVKDIYETLNTRSPIFTPLFTYLMEYKIRWKSRGYDTPIINRLICKMISEAMGGKLEHILVGGAPLNPMTQALIKAAFNLKQLTQGYGATETCGANTAMDLNDLTYGRIGIPLEGVNIKLIDWTEGGYLTTDKPNPRGEIVVGSDVVTLGYYKLPEVTEQTFFTDSHGIRWFFTGDIGEVDSNGSFKIIDRKKDLTKLPNGEYISLGKIEAALKSCKLVGNICIVTHTERNYLAALVTPNDSFLMVLAKQLGKPETYTREELCVDKDVCDEVYNCIEESARINNLNKVETPVRIKLCAEEWTPDNNLITAAFKLKRSNIKQYYKRHIETLFDS